MASNLGCRILVLWLAVGVCLGGCAAQEDTNKLIASGNSERFLAFTHGMNSATSEGARIAISMAFASNMGMQDYFREDSGVDYFRAVLPFAALLVPLALSEWGGSGAGIGGISAGRDVFIDSNHQHDAYSSATQDFMAGDSMTMTSSDATEGPIGEAL